MHSESRVSLAFYSRMLDKKRFWFAYIFTESSYPFSCGQISWYSRKESKFFFRVYDNEFFQNFRRTHFGIIVSRKHSSLKMIITQKKEEQTERSTISPSAVECYLSVHSTILHPTTSSFAPFCLLTVLPVLLPSLRILHLPSLICSPSNVRNVVGELHNSRSRTPVISATRRARMKVRRAAEDLIIARNWITSWKQQSVATRASVYSKIPITDHAQVVAGVVSPDCKRASTA